jgi:hypothetical protein
MNPATRNRGWAFTGGPTFSTRFPGIDSPRIRLGRRRFEETAALPDLTRRRSCRHGHRLVGRKLPGRRLGPGSLGSHRAGRAGEGAGQAVALRRVSPSPKARPPRRWPADRLPPPSCPSFVLEIWISPGPRLPAGGTRVGEVAAGIRGRSGESRSRIDRR